jgi:CheY-like chemotaxis protein
MCSIVLIEPHDDSRDLYARYLRLHGHHVRVAADITDVDVAAVRPDVLITESDAPGAISNFAFIHRLRQHPVLRGLHIIVVSSRAFPADEMRAKVAGCDRFLTKPCLPADLLSAVNALSISLERQSAKAACSSRHGKARRHR